ncbi:hypothetical protein PsorP6_018253 [Peronosclerospora sorghi]|uniref:Uncharacterized protein n=1 Tax=Peronosclerospora sorghi TaxID=230839 RepID=A0ACC0WC57_9STRA|nr:hypothetical protein PsorP6_018253 [Peronosclerospora sorghi]
MHKVLRRVLELWTPLTSFYGEKSTAFPLADKYYTLSQLYSLLAPAAYVMRDTQNGTPKNLSKGEISYAYEMACALSPQSVRLKFIDRIVADPLAIRAAEKIEEKRYSSEARDISSAKRSKTTSGPRLSFTRRYDSEFKGLGFLDNDEDEDRSGGEVDDSVVNVEEKVDEEFRRFQASFGPKKASATATSSSSESGSMFQASKTFRTDEVLDFWLNINCHYSYLACVAR